MSIKAQIFKILPFGKAPVRPGTTASIKELLEEVERVAGEAHQQAMEKAHAEAAAGTGPQAWDADWYGNTLDLSDEVEAMVGNWSWQHVQSLREVLSWAAASPQGQRAQAMRDEPGSPWSDGLEMLEEMQMALSWRTQDLLHQQSRGLHYSNEQRQELADALDELLNPEDV